jgi:hypothetical protein
MSDMETETRVGAMEVVVATEPEIPIFTDPINPHEELLAGIRQACDYFMPNAFGALIMIGQFRPEGYDPDKTPENIVLKNYRWAMKPTNVAGTPTWMGMSPAGDSLR